MPGMDGITLLREVQARDPEVVCLVMTGDGAVATAVEAMKAGALDYIVKPFQMGRIVPVLSRALYVHGLRTENVLLQRRVAEHVAELEKKNEALKAANDELEAFSDSVSHDLRAPLRAVCGFAQILVDDFSSQMPTEAQRMLQSISGSATRMNHLVEGLLRFAHLGEHSMITAQVDLSKIVHEVVEELGAMAPGVTIRIGELPDLCADATLMKQVFANLLSNAVKFSAKTRDAVVEVGSYRDQESCTVFVRDNGAGFDMQQAERLFSAFQRLHTHEEFEGTGIGLRLIKRIIERHGGRIWAEGKQNEGATFYFQIASPASRTIPTAPAGALVCN